jgi:hypothetical protein
MESDSNIGGSSSGRIQNLIEDLGDESFETRNEALITLKAMLPLSKFIVDEIFYRKIFNIVIII